MNLKHIIQKLENANLIQLTPQGYTLTMTFIETFKQYLPQRITANKNTKDDPYIEAVLLTVTKHAGTHFKTDDELATAAGIAMEMYHGAVIKV